ncbi:hypothetical protein Tco_0924572 [Tanacetum coccineum]|uniref:Uncharacterized protein n=1 Tax=Tanacetum coccineum TaxID=301880 RepID=A0ABQ5D791_9ASTR
MIIPRNKQTVLKTFLSEESLESKPKLVMDENTILNMDTIVISPDSDEILMLYEESRSKLLLKEQDLMVDLLSHISRSCPSINNFGPQIVEVTPRKKDKKVRSKDFLSTSASGSQPLSNT